MVALVQSSQSGRTPCRSPLAGGLGALLSGETSARSTRHPLPRGVADLDGGPGPGQFCPDRS